MLEGSSLVKFSCDSCGVERHWNLPHSWICKNQDGSYFINLNVQVILRGSFRTKIAQGLICPHEPRLFKKMYQHVSSVWRGSSVLAMHHVWKQSLWNKPAEKTVNQRAFFPNLQHVFKFNQECSGTVSLWWASNRNLWQIEEHTHFYCFSELELKQLSTIYWTEQISHTYILLSIDLSI